MAIACVLAFSLLGKSPNAIAENESNPAIDYLLLNTSTADNSWQERLEAQFDIVETFDELSDWSNASNGYVFKTDTPTRQDGQASIWQMYSTDFFHSGTEDVISNDGDYSWNRSASSTPKSLCLQHDVLYKTEDDSQQGWGVSGSALSLVTVSAAKADTRKSTSSLWLNSGLAILPLIKKSHFNIRTWAI